MEMSCKTIVHYHRPALTLIYKRHGTFPWWQNHLYYTHFLLNSSSLLQSHHLKNATKMEPFGISTFFPTQCNSLEIMRVVMCINILFSFVAEYSSVLWMHHRWFYPSPMKGHPSYFQFGDIIKEKLLWGIMYKFYVELGDNVFISWGKCLGVLLLGHMVIKCLVFWKKHKNRFVFF